jgi:hypothetical protein
MSMKNSNDTIGNGTRDLLACSAVPQLTLLSRAPLLLVVVLLLLLINTNRAKAVTGCAISRK